ncbi:MAG TPA: hypothetical protein VGI39_24305 [Polyangiaceae bacterium]|jgi:hypothetical protein
MGIRPRVGLGLAVVALGACSRGSSSPPDAAVLATAPDDLDALEVVAAVRSFWPLACDVYAAERRAAHCIDGEGRGPPVNALADASACLHEAAAMAKSAAAKLPARKATTACAASIEGDVIDGANGYGAALEGFAGWIDAHGPEMAGAMKDGGTLQEASPFFASSAEYAQVNERAIRVAMNDCVHSLVICDVAFEGSGCALPKLAGRLGVACPGTSRRPAKAPVKSKRTGHLLP